MSPTPHQQTLLPEVPDDGSGPAVGKVLDHATRVTLESLEERLKLGRPLKSAEYRMLERLHAKQVPEAAEIVPTLTALGEKLGVSPRTLIRWKKVGMPALAGGAGYDVAAVKKWRESTTDLDDSGLPVSWTEEIKRHKAELLRLKVEQESGRLVEKEAVEKALAARAAVLRTDFENWAYERAVTLADSFGIESARIPDLQVWLVEEGQAWFERYTTGSEVAT